MKLEDAIEVLTRCLPKEEGDVRDDLDDALKLGIEALKQVKKFQQMGSKINPLRLPGETTD